MTETEYAMTECALRDRQYCHAVLDTISCYLIHKIAGLARNDKIEHALTLSFKNTLLPQIVFGVRVWQIYPSYQQYSPPQRGLCQLWRVVEIQAA